MSLFRRWFDPIRSRWFFQKPMRQAVLSTEQGLCIYLRLDDVYSYLAVQQLTQLDELLDESLKPLQVVISDQGADAPNAMTEQEWHRYSLNDAAILAKQHRFSFDADKVKDVPKAEAIAQARTILQHTPLQGAQFFYLLEDVFHMLWQGQHGKLRTLFMMASQHQKIQNFAERRFEHMPILAAYFEFGERRYHAVDDLLRLTRRLKQQNLLTATPIFLINHIEWREHLLNDAEELAEIQAMHPELDLYIALEDPISWLLLAYIKEELVDYYNIQLNVYPLSYQSKDQFDWALASRLSKRTEVKFTPFCRPTPEATLHMAELFFNVPEEQSVEAMYQILQGVWTQGQDMAYKPHLEKMAKSLGLEQRQPIDVAAKLARNDQYAESLLQPSLPILELRIADQQFVFNSLYRVWMLESIFSNVLEQKYKYDNDAEQNDSKQFDPEQQA